ncbi:hypothetical protein Q5O89_16750 [Peribacillus frigoritolerans]|nr:hypothetical protein [Peribacillus frigoritolerans]
MEDKGKYMKASSFPDVPDNFTKIYHDDFQRIDNTIDLYIFACVRKWKNGAKYSYAEWSEMLGCTERYAVELIKGAVENKIIYKLEGDFNNGWVGAGQLKQDVNIYLTKPFLMSEKQEQIEKQVKNDAQTKNVAITLDEMEFADYRVGNWFDKKAFADEKDYHEYFNRKEEASKGDERAEKFVKHCESRIEQWLSHKNDQVRKIVAEKLAKVESEFKAKNHQALQLMRLLRGTWMS